MCHVRFEHAEFGATKDTVYYSEETLLVQLSFAAAGFFESFVFNNHAP